MSPIETTIPSTAATVAAQETLERRYKVKTITDYQSRTSRRNRMLQEATKLESKALHLQQERDQNETQTLLTRKITAAWNSAIKGLRLSERQLDVVRGKAAAYDSETLFQRMEIVKTQIQRMDLEGIAAEYERLERIGSRTDKKAFGEIAANRLFEISHDISLDKEDRTRANNLKSRIERALTELETNDTVSKFEAELDKAQDNVAAVLNMIDEAERIFGWNGMLGGSPFAAMSAQVRTDRGRVVESVPESAATGYPVGYVPIKEAE